MDSSQIQQPAKRIFPNTIFRVLYTLAALALLSLIAVWLNVFVESSTNTDDCLWQMALQGNDTVLLVQHIIPEGSAQKAGIQEGDRVVAINGHSLSARKNSDLQLDLYAQNLLNHAPTDKPISYVVERNGTLLNLKVTLRTLGNLILIQRTLPITYSIFAALWLLIGLVVGLTRPRGYVQVLFFLTGLTVFFSFSGPAGVLATTGWAVVWTLAGTAFYPAWVLFCAAFPVRQKILESKKRKFWLFTIVGVPMLVTVLTIVSNGEIGNNAFIAGLKLICSIYFGVGVWFLFRGYFRMPARSDRRPMRVILVGTVITACVLFYILTIGSIQQNVISSWRYLIVIPATLFVALPLSFGYAIFRYQLMDVRAVVKTALVYTLTTGSILGVYLILALRIGKVAGSMLGDDMERVVQITILTMFLIMFEPVRRWIQRLVDLRFFPQYRDYSGHLSDYGAQITEAIGVDQVAELMAQTLREQLKLEAICVAVINEGNRLEPVASICGEGTRFDDEGTQRLQEILHASHELTVLNARQEEALWSIVKSGFAYAIGLYAGGRTIGAILLGRRTDGKAVSGSQVSFINGVASQGASGIEAARLYERELARRRYEEELATARRIQQSLLPSTMPKIPGIGISAVSHPAMAVGGDYYEVIPLPNKRFLAMIADVSGKGLPASLYMAELHGMVRMAGSIRQTPREMLILLNNHLSTSLERGSFITATITLFDLTAGTVTIARAGHTPILRLRGTHTDSFVPKGLPLGIRSLGLFAESLEEITLDYLAGDRFVLYSDGISEAMNEDREEFGDERLLEVLAKWEPGAPTEHCTTTVLKSVEKFRGDAEQNDDITMVAVEIVEDQCKMQHLVEAIEEAEQEMAE